MNFRSIILVLPFFFSFTIYLLYFYYAYRYGDALDEIDGKDDVNSKRSFSYLCQEVTLFQAVIFVFHNNDNDKAFLTYAFMVAFILETIFGIVLYFFYSIYPSRSFFKKSKKEEEIEKINEENKTKNSTITKRSNQKRKLILAGLFSIITLTVLIILHVIVREKSILFYLLSAALTALCAFVMLLPAIFIKCPSCSTRWFLIFSRKISRTNLWASTPPKCPICGW